MEFFSIIYGIFLFWGVFMKKSSVILTGAIVVACMLAVLFLDMFALDFAKWFVALRNLDAVLKIVIPIAFWICSVPTMIALGCLLILLKNILSEYIFHSINSHMMTVICWCCLSVALVTSIATYWYIPFIAVAASMIFLCLIVSIVRGCFNTAITLREENELTI